MRKMGTLRPLQEKAFQQYRLAFKQGMSHLGVAGTGFGKTVFFAELADRMVPKTGHRFVIVSHREGLVWQNGDKVSRWTKKLKVGMERAEHTADVDSDVISASIQTLQGERLARCAAAWSADGRPIFLVIDEAHHAVADTYQELMRVLKHERRLGLTATPFRPDDDEGDALRAVFPNVAFEVKRSEMIDEKWLARPRSWLIQTEESLEGISSRKGDYSEKKLEAALDVDRRNGLILAAANDAKDELRVRFGQPTARGVGFAISVEHAEHLAGLFAANGWDAAAITGKTKPDDRRMWDERLRTATKPTILFSYGVLTEGWDVEQVNLALIARPTKSLVLADQMLGRALRFLDDKPDAIILDFGDAGDDERITVASTFRLPRRWDAAGECLREDEKWFLEQNQTAPWTVRWKLWEATSRREIEAMLATASADELALFTQTGWMWWNLGDELRMVVGTHSVVVKQGPLGDFEVKDHHGSRVATVASQGTILKALGAGERYVIDTYPNEARFLQILPDAGKPCSDAQRGLLEKMSIVAPPDSTSHQASMMITKAFMERAREVERGLMGFGKHKGQPIASLSTHYMKYLLTDEKMKAWMVQADRPEVHMFHAALKQRGVTIEV